MPTLAARVSVSVAAAVVVMAGLEALRLRHPRLAAATGAEAAPARDGDDTTPLLGPGTATVTEPETARGARPRGGPTMARIHGRVVGSKGALDDVEMEVEDASHAYDPRIDDQGFFEINLPPGTYTVWAWSNDLVAAADVASLLAEEDREVNLVLTPGVAITGRIEGCDGACADAVVSVEAPGSREQKDMTQADGQGRFVLDGLVPGRAYDLAFTADGMRRLLMRNLKAPMADLVVKLEPAATLSGGFGVPPGQKCPMESVTLDTPGKGSHERDTRFDRACRFQFDDLPDVDSVHLSVDGTGWHFEVDVPLPAQGDPPFLCLHPPCREPEPEPKASLAVTLQGAPTGSAYISVEDARGHGVGSSGCVPSSGPCLIEDLHPGPDVTVDVHVRGCETRTFKVNLLTGTNYLTSSCERLRDIQGVIRGANGKRVAAGARVRCSDDHPEVPMVGFLFLMKCPARLTNIEYRLAEDGPWQAAAISEGDGEGTGFVDIDAG